MLILIYNNLNKLTYKVLISIGAAFVLKLSSVICHRKAALPFNNQALFANNPALLRNTRALLKVHKKSRTFCALFLKKVGKNLDISKIICTFAI